MSATWQDAVVLITSNDPTNDSFGTGFVIAHDAQSTYLATCAHVVRDIGGSGQIVFDRSIKIVDTIYIDYDADLAVFPYGKTAKSARALVTFYQSGRYIISYCWFS